MFFDSLFILFNFFFFSEIILKKLGQTEKNRLFSTFHALFTFGNSLCFLNNQISIDFYLRVSVLSIVYAIYDIYFLIKYKTHSYKYLIIHHLIIIIANLWINFWGDLTTLNLVAYNYLTEISTPFLNLCLYLYQNKKKDLAIFKINIFKVSNLILVTTFFTFRILFGIYLIKKYFFYNWLFIFQIILFYLNCIWFFKILKKCYYFIIN